MTAGQLLQEVLRSALATEAGSTVSQWPEVPEHLQKAFVEEVLRHRVASVITPVVGHLGLKQSGQERLITQRSHDILDSMRLQSLAATVCDQLAQAGIRAIVYKGVALAAQTTKDPSARGFGDLDVLIDPLDVPRAHQVLEGLGGHLVAGYLPAPGTPLWPTARRIGCEAPYWLNGVSLDLHWRIDRTPQIARLPFEELWQRRTSVVLAGRSVPTLGVIDSLLVTCVHGTKEHWYQWRWVVDAVRQCGRCQPNPGTRFVQRPIAPAVRRGWPLAWPSPKN